MVDALRAGEEVTATRGARICTFKESERVIAGFSDGRAGEGPAAGEPSLRGLRLARENDWAAPPMPPEAREEPEPSAPEPQAASEPEPAPEPVVTAAEETAAESETESGGPEQPSPTRRRRTRTRTTKEDTP
jgi:NADH-quinone oxidoreductase subunit E